MRILADENIAYVQEAFTPFGEVKTLHGREINAQAAARADVLLIRSSTPVNAQLLDAARPLFVGAASSGIDHVDLPYLKRRGIPFAHAPGSNANSVAEYVVAALAWREHETGSSLKGQALGIVGHGHIGKRVDRMAEALGMRTVLHDPPLARITGDSRYRPLEALFDCDAITVHVPLIDSGPDRTRHLVDEAFLRNMKEGAVLMNTSRGPVVDSRGLHSVLPAGRLGACLLDVWEGEPEIDSGLLARVTLGTSHIAGYSFDGKVKGTHQIHEALARVLGREPAWDPETVLPPAECPRISVRSKDSALWEIIAQVYDIRKDDAALRKVTSVPPRDRAAFFDTLRKEYPRRREFFNTAVSFEYENKVLETTLEGLGFRMIAMADAQRIH